MGNNGLRVQIASYNTNLAGAETTRHDLTPWLIPTAEQKPTGPRSSKPLTNSKVLQADAYKSTNTKTLSTHPSLPREAPDFYAIGFQELIPLHTGLSASGDTELYNTDLDIRRTIRPHQAVVSGNGMYASLEEGGGPEGYPLLCKVDLVSIALFVYARERAPFSISKATAKSAKGAAHRVKEIRTAKVGTGVAGIMGNKGGVGARIVVAAADGQGPDEILTFISAHLAAHDHNVFRRNKDWQQIVQRMIFEPSSVQKLPILQDPNRKPLNPNDMDSINEQHDMATSGKGSERTVALDQNSYTVYDTTHLFVFGDLNHRLALGKSELAQVKGEKSESELTKETLAQALEIGDWHALSLHDQLSHQRLCQPPNAFHGLTEVPIHEAGIPPTYKYVVCRSGKQTKKKNAGVTFDSLEGETLSKKRIPGWTDRILWASAPFKDSNDKHGVEVELYRSIMQYTHSDHKPITSLLRLPPASGDLLTSLNPYKPLPSTQRLVLSTSGMVMDRLVGYTWSLLLLMGGGSLAGGLIEVFVIGFITAWWFSRS
ncbi:related to INP54 - Phosphatidylinositol 4,5-bisphosphate 5-phosphatase [Melanopsichium pennsylvanicum]|uniref:Related to INP54 - Phosphatidylinositol 4,5-bisphosphate 5-phosphatase n=2 Tax=Melanopsichium pennsylvanicum TaxID=63383 RepID=A0AAJ5C3V5_9BASI|nr:inositol polyphosphate phosphatase [Melanopsichium pennsylvanicum 4]SNX82982.1 related to INP54 - Phosphatidylinositol 4,5-bisphosphate 5-phosphatase [Melanopsichium pennsylvanicum]